MVIQLENILPLGLVVHDTEDKPWIYCGCVLTKGHLHRRFTKAYMGVKGENQCNYQARKRETLIKKFPDLAKHWPDFANMFVS